MATISSHVLDSVIGTHASGIRVQCFRCLSSGKRQLVFDVIACAEGRISETVDLAEAERREDIELVFHTSDYYAAMTLPDDGYQIMPVVVVRLTLPNPDVGCHIPVMLSPHSYSIWWSGSGQREAS